MSMHVPGLSDAAQCVLDGPAFRPLIRHGLQEVFLDYDDDDVNKECDPCTILDDKAFAQCSEPESQFRRRDLEDFCKIWLGEHPGEFFTDEIICGRWVIDEWPESGEKAVTILQFRTFRICVRAGPDAEAITISTADIRALIDKYLRNYQGYRVPQCVGYASYKGRTPFQWLIIPISAEELHDSIERFAASLLRPYDPRKLVLGRTQESVPVDPETLDAISRRVGPSY